MASSDGWRPSDENTISIEYIGENLPEQTRWPVRPWPMPDELLSSWLNRVAGANGLAPRSFYLSLARAVEWTDTIYRYQRLDADTRIKLKETSWVDFCCNKRLAKYLEERSGVSARLIQGLSLRRPPDVGAGSMTPLGTLQWALVEALPDMVCHDNENYAYMRFCPRCLREWKYPWFRKSWRLRTVNVCVRHRCHLLLTCVCGRGVRPHLLKEAQSQTICYACGHDLLYCEAEPAHPDAVEEQLEINWRLYDGVEKILKNGGGRSRIVQLVKQPIRSVGPQRLDLRRTGLIDVFTPCSPLSLRLIYQAVIRRRSLSSAAQHLFGPTSIGFLPSRGVSYVSN